MARRVAELHAKTRETSRYSTQKTTLERELVGFLSSLSCPQSIASALSRDLVAFLILERPQG